MKLMQDCAWVKRIIREMVGAGENAVIIFTTSDSWPRYHAESRIVTVGRHWLHACKRGISRIELEKRKGRSDDTK